MEKLESGSFISVVLSNGIKSGRKLRQTISEAVNSMHCLELKARAKLVSLEIYKCLGWERERSDCSAWCQRGREKTGIGRNCVKREAPDRQGSGAWACWARHPSYTSAPQDPFFWQGLPPWLGTPWERGVGRRLIGLPISWFLNRNSTSQKEMTQYI